MLDRECGDEEITPLESYVNASLHIICVALSAKNIYIILKRYLFRGWGAQEFSIPKLSFSSLAPHSKRETN